MTTKKLPGILLGDREIRVLIFLWKWKLISTAALTSSRFFPNASPARAYNRLLDLKRVGLIEVRCDGKIQNFVWSLTTKGFKAIREFLPALREEGYKSEYVEHDLLVSAFHLGDWLFACPSYAKVFTEQELRRCSLDEYPSWVPKTEVHRPDGYFGFSGDDKVIPVAIEIEINRKPVTTYAGLGGFYADLQNIFRVLWVVPSISAATRIQTAICKSANARTNIHNFILVSDFKDRGWQSPIVSGPDAGKTIRAFLSEIPRRKAVESPWNSTAQLLLNTRRSYVKSKASAKSSTPPKIEQPAAIPA